MEKMKKGSLLLMDVVNKKDESPRGEGVFEAKGFWQLCICYYGTGIPLGLSLKADGSTYCIFIN